MSSGFANKRVFLIGGSGGVGKTTVAASLAVALAQAGYKTIVLTVDPARRLAQALGLEGFNQELHEVSLPSGAAPLFASMLDTRRYFDRIIEKFATSAAQRDRILNNPLYRITIEHLGGTHEYAAMERLLEFASDKSYDRVVVDTPPTQNALDLFSAPQRLADFMDNSVLRWFQGRTPLYLKFFKQGSKLALKVLKGIFGGEFIDALGKFMDDLEGMQAGFRTRNLEVLELLRGQQTAFCLVTYPTEIRYREAIAFQRALAANRIALSALILNRVEPPFPSELSVETLPPELAQLLHYYRALRLEQEPWIEKLRQAFPSIAGYRLEKKVGPLHDLPSLSQLGRHLLE